MSDQDDQIDWTAADSETARFIHSQAEIHLQAQLQCALASDQRATTFGSILASVSAAVFAGVIALWEELERDALVGGLCMAALLLIAAAFGAWAARPIDFFVPGARPDQLYHVRGAPLTTVMGYAAENYQHDIDENERFMAGNQSALRAGFAVALASPLIAAVVWWLA